MFVPWTTVKTFLVQELLIESLHAPVGGDDLETEMDTAKPPERAPVTMEATIEELGIAIKASGSMLELVDSFLEILKCLINGFVVTLV